MKKTYKSMLMGVLIGMLSGPQWGYTAASGNYTDLLPIGAAGNTTVISNGSGWSLTTLAPSQSFGDALSRAPMTVYQSTSNASIANTTSASTVTAISGQGFVGSTTFPAGWVASGRTIRVTYAGWYSMSLTTGTWTWDVLLGTTTILTTGAATPAYGQTNKRFTAQALITVQATGNAGTASGFYDIYVTSAATAGTANVVAFSTAPATPVSVDWTTQLTVNPRFKWSDAASGNTITITNAVVEFLN